VPNIGTASLNVDGLGTVYLKKLVPDISSARFEHPGPGELGTLAAYLLLFDGFRFQILTSRPAIASENDLGIVALATADEVAKGLNTDKAVTPKRLQDKLNKTTNKATELEIQPSQLIGQVGFSGGRNKYMAVNGNLIIPKDIRLIATEPIPAQVIGHIANLPKPAETSTSGVAFAVFSTVGSYFSASIDEEGKLFIAGTFTNNNEELLLDFKPYVAKYPLEYFGQPPR